MPVPGSRCPNGHPLYSHTHANPTTGAWWCDGCGNAIAAGDPAFGCGIDCTPHYLGEHNYCNYDLCNNCFVPDDSCYAVKSGFNLSASATAAATCNGSIPVVTADLDKCNETYKVVCVPDVATRHLIGRIGVRVPPPPSRPHEIALVFDSEFSVEGRGDGYRGWSFTPDCLRRAIPDCEPHSVADECLDLLKLLYIQQQQTAHAWAAGYIFCDLWDVIAVETQCYESLLAKYASWVRGVRSWHPWMVVKFKRVMASDKPSCVYCGKCFHGYPYHTVHAGRRALADHAANVCKKSPKVILAGVRSRTSSDFPDSSKWYWPGK
eukprot:gene5173-4743_t